MDISRFDFFAFDFNGFSECEVQWIYQFWRISLCLKSLEFWFVVFYILLGWSLGRMGRGMYRYLGVILLLWKVVFVLVIKFSYFYVFCFGQVQLGFLRVCVDFVSLFIQSFIVWCLVQVRGLIKFRGKGFFFYKYFISIFFFKYIWFQFQIFVVLKIYCYFGGGVGVEGGEMGMCLSIFLF